MLAGEHPLIDPDDSWKTLFNGTDLRGWWTKKFDGRPTEPGGWVVEGNALVRERDGNCYKEEEFGDFILDLEFRIGPKGDSGIILRYDRNPQDKNDPWNRMC